MSSPNPPEFIIAFRGTIIEPKGLISKDLSHNWKFVRHKLHRSPRVLKAFDTVLRIVELARRPQNVWLTGHSLGAAISLAVGRKLVIEKDLKLETFLFNPPIVSSPFEFSKFVNFFIKTTVHATISMVHESKKTLEIGERFNKLSSWAPHLFINKNDPICNGFISYFENRDMMMAWMGAGSAKKMVYKCSLIGLIGKGIRRDWEPIHLLPSAILTITSRYHSPLDLFKAHEIVAWMEKDLLWDKKKYEFNEINHSI
ncbi:hydrolase [Lithospermum erythrorhizon]